MPVGGMKYLNRDKYVFPQVLESWMLSMIELKYICMVGLSCNNWSPQNIVPPGSNIRSWGTNIF